MSRGVVVVSDGKIVAAGSSAQVPAGARVVDLGDATLLPGLMDAHTHLSFESSLDWKQDQLDSLKKPIPEQAIIATEYARRTLLAGFTSALTVNGHVYNIVSDRRSCPIPLSGMRRDCEGIDDDAQSTRVRSIGGGNGSLTGVGSTGSSVNHRLA